MTSEEVSELVAMARTLDGLAPVVSELNSQFAGILDQLRELHQLLPPILDLCLTTLDAANAVGERLKSE
jgi:hypothetical protein